MDEKKYFSCKLAWMASQREMPVKYSPYKNFFSNLRANTGHPRYSKNESKYDTFFESKWN